MGAATGDDVCEASVIVEAIKLDIELALETFVETSSEVSDIEADMP